MNRPLSTRLSSVGRKGKKEKRYCNNTKDLAQHNIGRANIKDYDGVKNDFQGLVVIVLVNVIFLIKLLNKVVNK